jgi:hypothetical protein
MIFVYSPTFAVGHNALRYTYRVFSNFSNSLSVPNALLGDNFGVVVRDFSPLKATPSA